MMNGTRKTLFGAVFFSRRIFSRSFLDINSFRGRIGKNEISPEKNLRSRGRHSPHYPRDARILECRRYVILYYYHYIKLFLLTLLCGFCQRTRLPGVKKQNKNT